MAPWRRESFTRRSGRGKDGRDAFRSIDPSSRNGAAARRSGTRQGLRWLEPWRRGVVSPSPAARGGRRAGASFLRSSGIRHPSSANRPPPSVLRLPSSVHRLPSSGHRFLAQRRSDATFRHRSHLPPVAPPSAIETWRRGAVSPSPAAPGGGRTGGRFLRWSVLCRRSSVLWLPPTAYRPPDSPAHEITVSPHFGAQ